MGPEGGIDLRMKVRIGFGLGNRSELSSAEVLGDIAAGLEAHGFDSLWFAERVTGPLLDPLVAMSWVAGRTAKLKFGPAVMVLPGRNPVLLAKELASLDAISGGRLLPAFGLGVVNPAEHQAFGVRREERSALFDEALPLIRRLWSEESVDHRGEHFELSGVSIRPQPVQQPLEVWLGGISPTELRRTARLGDGWLPSFCTPGDLAEAIPTVAALAEQHGRHIDDGHYGALLVYGDRPLPDELISALRSRRPDVDPAQLVASNHKDLRDRIEAFCEIGASKFVVMPLFDPPSWEDELAALADAILHLQT